MADGDHYASYADVRNYLSNQGIGVAGNTLYDNGSLELALDVTQTRINQYIHGDSGGADVTGTGQVNICKSVQCELIFMMILMARHIQNNNLNDAGAIQAFWQVTPSLTREHRLKLDIIQYNEDGVAFAYSTETGYQV